MADGQTNTWPELAIGLYDKLTGREAEITYTFEDMRVEIPSRTGNGAARAEWKLNGSLKISTRDGANGRAG